MEKIKYYQLAFKDGKCKKLVSPGKTEIAALEADGWALAGFDSDPGFSSPVLDNGTVREMTQTEIEAAKEAEKLERTVFTQLEVREAFKSLDKEADLDALLDGNPEFDTYWLEAKEIDLEHPVTINAILELGLTNTQINEIKIQVGG